VIENIDIGGPSMIRSAAKNFHDVAIVTSPAITSRCRKNSRSRADALTRDQVEAAQKAFATTAAYDSAIASTLERVKCWCQQRFSAATNQSSVKRCAFRFRRLLNLRYGENPHQNAQCTPTGSGNRSGERPQLQGKELSYNNMSICSCVRILPRSHEPVCAIIKHTNPCGTGTGQTLAEAYRRALECDLSLLSAASFGVESSDRREAAEEMHKLFSRSHRGAFFR